MTMAQFNEGDVVRVVVKKSTYDAGAWGDVDLTVVPTTGAGDLMGFEHLANPNSSYRGAIRREYLAPVLVEGDVVSAADGSGELGTVVKVSKKGRWATIERDGGTEKWYTPELRLVSHWHSPDEVIAGLRARVRDLEDGADLLKKQQRAAQYASDRALAHAGLVRIEVLAQWNAELHERLPREGSPALLADIRTMIEKAKENTR